MVLGHDINQQRTSDVIISQDVSFDTMLISKNTLNGLNAAGFLKPSPIQLQGIPLGKCGFDLLLEAKSGTGKTAVFAVIALEKINVKKGLQVIILAPTREIASQICDVIRQIGSQYHELNVEVVMGGIPVQEDIAKFKNKKNVHILVGSPGRVKHLIQDKFIETNSVRLLVLDEADKLLEKSFQADINFIFSSLPKQKQVIMSSATYPDNTRNFIQNYVENSHHICPDSSSILLGIEQKITTVKYNSNIVKQTKIRYEELIKILSTRAFKQCLIFCNYQIRVKELHRMLTQDKWPSEQLSGLQQQSDRLDALKILQEYKCRILIATDLAARGIDASNVDLVINFEPPFDWQTYLHRIGRAGRYGAYGLAISILSQGTEETKFRKSLFTLKDFLKINDLWTDKLIALNDLEESLEEAYSEDKLTVNISSNQVKNIEHKNMFYQNVWGEILTPVHRVENIQSFENLNNSFQESFVKESFSDLLESFTNCQIDTSTDIGFNIFKNNTFVNNIKADHISDLNANGQIVNDLLTTKSQQSCEINSYDKNKDVQSNEMSRLGLPTSFGKRKDDKSKKPSFPESFKTTKVLRNSKENSNSKHCFKSTFPKKNTANILKNIPKHRKPVEVEESTHVQYLQPIYNSEKNYIDWYKKVKHQTKQIEMVFYIEEITKYT